MNSLEEYYRPSQPRSLKETIEEEKSKMRVRREKLSSMVGKIRGGRREDGGWVSQ